MFEGSVSLSLDAKGRLAIPARHREALAVTDGPLVLTAHPHGCLLLYPLATWEPIRDKILQAPSFNLHSQSLKRLMVGSQQRIEALDSAGRILVTPELREYARLEKTVWMNGMGSHFEILSDEEWQRQKALARQAAEAMANGVPPPGFEDIAL
ncbi:MAG: division/cell wall cluster transcriptional repressor MraZ [Zoogloeaceae bacterium]|jgi:MraZ protein|nr:division/cell wall cluster transcriptional repressor MraZ [Zoogloeaceae bacterium]